MGVTRKSLSSRECAKLLKALSEEMRLQILQCLFRGERSVSEIAKELGEDHSKVSHHLGILRNMGLVSDKKEGKFVVYEIHPLIYKQIRRGAYENALDLRCCSIIFHNDMKKF
jgi:ArsR family transcriptional regulator